MFSFIVRFHALAQPGGAPFYSTGLLQIDPQSNTTTISRPDGTNFSWTGNADNWISLDGVHWDAS
jgi:hypothetical protein